MAVGDLGDLVDRFRLELLVGDLPLVVCNGDLAFLCGGDDPISGLAAPAAASSDGDITGGGVGGGGGGCCCCGETLAESSVSSEEADISTCLLPSS